MKNDRQAPEFVPSLSGTVSLDQPTGQTTVLSPPSAGAGDRRLLSLLQRTLEPEPVRIELWDGSSCYRSADTPRATVVVRDRATLLRLLWNPDLNFGEALSAGRLDVQGDLVAVIEAANRTSSPTRRVNWWLDGWVAQVDRSNSLHDSRDNIHHHYDIGNDFYRLWLDRDLVYTCAYFSSPAMSLEDAQVAKMHHVCRKLRLQPGERVAEVGCGWGALALHMARHYGVTVKAFNIAHEQIAYARDRAAREGLSDRVEFIEDDYRNVRGEFDAFVSVGMLEHVGRAHYGELGDVIYRSLKTEGGRGLLHFIGRNYPRPLNAWIRKRIFPGGYPPTLAEVTSRVFEPWDLSVLDVENLRLHYARTLQHWLARFEAAVDRVRTMFDEPFVRAWRLYLAGSQAAFTTGSLQLFQIVFARGHDNQIAWTRADLYRE